MVKTSHLTMSTQRPDAEGETPVVMLRLVFRPESIEAPICLVGPEVFRNLAQCLGLEDFPNFIQEE